MTDSNLYFLALFITFIYFNYNFIYDLVNFNYTVNVISIVFNTEVKIKFSRKWDFWIRRTQSIINSDNNVLIN
jgi:hypothetical protein